jgi:hypothetical protein
MGIWRALCAPYSSSDDQLKQEENSFRARKEFSPFGSREARPKRRRKKGMVL